MFGDLGRLLGRFSEEMPLQRPVDPRPQGIGSVLGRSLQLPFTAEDDAIVNTNQGRMPLNQVEGNIQRLPDPFAREQEGIGYNLGAGVNRSLPVLPDLQELLRRR